MPGRRLRRRLAVLVCVIVLTGTTGVAYAAFVTTATNPTDTFGTVADFVAPTVNRSTAATTAGGGLSQHVTPGKSYYVYADVTDTGNPASGAATVTTDASTLTTGQTAAAMTAGAYSFAGVNYNYRTALLTANNNATLSACSYLPTLTATDVAGNVATTNASTVMVDRDLLSDYNVRLDGAAAGDEASYGVFNAGDVNGDGKPDALVGAWSATNNGRLYAGSVYVIFGQTAATTIDLGALGTLGFRVDGTAGDDELGLSVAAAGDLNGDGKADLLLGADWADSNGFTNNGAVFVVFGKATTTTIDLTTLGAGGYRINGVASNDAAGTQEATIADLNADGKPEVIVNAWLADNNGRTDSGSTYVVFGKATTTTINLSALGAGGYRIDAAAAGDHTTDVKSIGDLNADGKPEVLIGGREADNNSRTDSGSVYVVWGKSTTTTVDLAALGAQGYRIDGAAAGEWMGVVVDTVPDLNADGKPDVLVTTFRAGNNGRALSGSAYVLWGKSTTTTIDLASLGTQGYRIDGAAANENTGYDVTSIPDVNSDGLPDLLVSAARADNNGRTDSGSIYVLWGKSTTTTIDLASLGTQGYRIDGGAATDFAGFQLSAAGDVNADGRPDLIVSARWADNNSRTDSGSAYILFAPTCS